MFLRGKVSEKKLVKMVLENLQLAKLVDGFKCCGGKIQRNYFNFEFNSVFEFLIVLGRYKK